jgi:phosphoribosyl-ATP pyrophosphohydrolase
MADKKRFSYVAALYRAHDPRGTGSATPAVKRILRKLVREAVEVSWHRAEDQSITDLAKTVAKELVP